MVLFVVAIFVHFFFQIALARRSAQREREPAWLKLTAACSLFLWLSIGVAGRAIGYV
jgi:NADH:ubiquinone oxidoreductase subunit 6 (subunit J)